MNQLKSEIKHLRRQNASHRYYIPESSFFKLITEEVIRRSLATSPSYQRDEIVQRVLDRGRKIFGILALIDCTAELSKFIDVDQLQDTRLPFKKETLIQDVHLSSAEAEDFFERQWELTAPTFYRGTLHRCLPNNTVLPFPKEKKIGRGSFGTVYEVTLDPGHQELDNVFPERVRLGYSMSILLVANLPQVCQKGIRMRR